MENKLGQSATQRECNTKIVQRGKSAKSKKCNMKRKQLKKSAF